MKMDIVYSFAGFAAEARGVIVVDRTDFPVEKIENLDLDRPASIKVVTNQPSEQRRFSGSDLIGRDQRTSAEVAEPQATGKFTQLMERHADGDDALDRTGDRATERHTGDRVEVVAAKTGLRHRNIGIKSEPWRGGEVISKLHALTTPRPAGFGRAGVTGKYELGVDIQTPKR